MPKGIETTNSLLNLLMSVPRSGYNERDLQEVKLDLD
jgi:hypothetical protein